MMLILLNVLMSKSKVIEMFLGLIPIPLSVLYQCSTKDFVLKIIYIIRHSMTNNLLYHDNGHGVGSSCAVVVQIFCLSKIYGGGPDAYAINIDLSFLPFYIH